ncbi:proto-oncogene tyrosine-protein kinase receptor Ret-like isoform X2 [Ptychodera flava]|uniref:proto-oncogene tyrosine-protein kinase receptor Ret-like isoform X2 n=1 Tax=Ptychodera flava TaxID=63121 RepID=UPI00396A63AC
MSIINSTGKWLCLWLAIVSQVTGLYFPKPTYTTSIPVDVKPLQPIMPFHVIYHGLGSLTFSLKCQSILQPCDSRDDPESCEIPCTEIPFTTIGRNIVSTESLSNCNGWRFSLTVTAVLNRPQKIYREEATTRILVLVEQRTNIFPCSVCFVEDRIYFLTKRAESNSKTFATMKSFGEQQRCPDVQTSYSIAKVSEHLPFEISTSTGILATKSISLMENTDEINVLVTCEVIGGKQSNTSESVEVKVHLLRVDASGPSVPSGTYQLAAHVIGNRDKGNIVPVPGLEVYDKDIIGIDDYNVTIEQDECAIFKIGKIILKTIREDNGEDTFLSKVETDLKLKTPISHHRQLCSMQVIFIDNSFPPSVNVSTSITFNVMIEFKEVPFKFQENPYETSLYRNASIHTQVLKTSLPTYIVSDKPFSYAIEKPSPDVIYRRFGLEMEPTYGLIYVANTTLLRRLSVDRINFTVFVTNGESHARTDVTIHLVKSEEAPENCEPKQCSTFDRKDECEKVCGIGSPTGRCQWLDNKRKGMQYSTCTPHIATCPDKVCDYWESQHPELCLQDCVERSKISGSIRPVRSNQKGERGITMARGICYCTASRECFCGTIPPSLSTFVAIDVEKQAAYMQMQTITPNGGKVFEMPVVPIETVCDSDCKTLVSLGVSCGSVLVIVAVITLRYNRRKKRRRSPKKYSAKDVGSNISISAIPSDYLDDTPPLVQEKPDSWIAGHNRSTKTDYDPKWEFSRSNLLFEKVIGEGEFGRVIRAQALNIRGLTGYTAVAVKMVKHGSSNNELRDLITELNLLKQVNHPNVIKLLGCCTQKGPLYVICEFCEHGSLRNYLRECRRLETLYVQDQFNADINSDESPVDILTARDLVSFSWQICKGMQYLAEMKLVHRDLASRNILVADGKIMKISDFGLTRDIYESDAYLKKSKGRIPVKWMAVESLYDQMYTTKSDVWSFGVLLWEIVTLGATPYPGIPPERLFHILKTGHRMEKPDNCSEELYDIMLRCWKTRPQERPTFVELGQLFEQMLEHNREYLDLSSGASYSDSEADQKDEEEAKVNLITSESEDGSQDRASDESLYGEIKFISLSRSCSDIQKVKTENSQMAELPQRPRCHSSAIPCTYNKCNSTEV